MSQHDMVLDNASGQNVRLDMTAAVQALASTSLGPVAPATPYAGQLWLDTSGGGNGALKIRDVANAVWKTLFPSVDGAGSGAGVPTGTILEFAGATAPTGYLMCFGQTVLRADYPALFSAIGVTYGPGDGSTNFVLPDLRGRFVAGKDNMGGAAAGRLTGATGSVNGALLGAVGGAEGVALTIAEIPAHGHGANTTINGGSNVLYYNGSGTVAAGTGIAVYFSGLVTLNAQTSIANAGGGAMHNNVPPVIIMNKIIKT